PHHGARRPVAAHGRLRARRRAPPAGARTRPLHAAQRARAGGAGLARDRDVGRTARPRAAGNRTHRARDPAARPRGRLLLQPRTLRRLRDRAGRTRTRGGGRAVVGARGAGRDRPRGGGRPGRSGHGGDRRGSARRRRGGRPRRCAGCPGGCRGVTAVSRTPLDGVDVVLADLDGVVYASHLAIPHAVEALNAAAASGRRVGYLTNNAARTSETVAAQLRELGLAAEPDDVVSSPQAAVVLLRELVPPGSTVLVVGGAGLVTALEDAGFRVTRSADDAPAAVVQGFAPEVAWTDLAEAAFALKGGEAGIPWVATNTDWTIPRARGTAPGNGTLVSAVHTAVGRLPVVAGKPERALFDLAVESFGATRQLVSGGRPATDCLGASRAGMESLQVLTDTDGTKKKQDATTDSRPHYVVEDLRGLAATSTALNGTTDAR